MIPLRVVIVDDEEPARDGLRIRLKREPGIVIVAEFASVRAAVPALRADPPDLLFLDIEMPGADGFSLVAALEGVAMPMVVFATAHDRHAVRAFDVNAFDYLLKPIGRERLSQTIARARDFLTTARKGDLADRVRGLVDGEPVAHAVEASRPAGMRIPVRVDGIIRLVDPADVDYIEASGDAIRLHAGSSMTSIRMSMNEVMAMLDSRQFLRIHRSTIVNIERVRELQPYFHGEYVVVLSTGVKLKLSRGYRDAARWLFGRL